MTRRYQTIVMVLLAVLLLRLSITGDFLLYVKPAMRPWLVTAGVVLTVVAVSVQLSQRRSPPADEHGHDGDGGHGSRLAWLLALPVVALFVVAPAPLGAFAASRQAAWRPEAPSSADVFPPLVAEADGVYELGLQDYNIRAVYDTGSGLADKRVRLSGFVRPDGKAADSFLLTRFTLSCCAADGIPVSVRVIASDGAAPATDSWVQVEGAWQPGPIADGDWAAIAADTIVPIPQPADPYES